MADPVQILASEKDTTIELWKKDNGEKYIVMLAGKDTKILSMQEFFYLAKVLKNAERKLYSGS